MKDGILMVLNRDGHNARVLSYERLQNQIQRVQLPLFLHPQGVARYIDRVTPRRSSFSSISENLNFDLFLWQWSQHRRVIT